MKFIQKEHGNGGKQTYELINELFKPIFDSEILKRGDDSSIFDLASKRLE